MSTSEFTAVADIGGTNTRVALASNGMLRAESVRRYKNADFSSFDSVLRAYLEEKSLPSVQGICVALAGPVSDGAGNLTNLDWRLEEGHLASETGADRVRLLNDLQAQGHALGRIASEHIIEVVAGRNAPSDATKMVIGVGTGFNAATVVETPVGRVVLPSESGHANLPVRNERELRLCRFVETAHGFPAIEDVLSGRGLERVFTFLGAEQGINRSASAADIMASVAQGDVEAEAALEMFIGLLGTVAGNLALIQLPFGGVYLAGGVARSISPYLTRMGFDAAFRNKGRFAEFMAEFPVSVIDDDFAALNGCAAFLDAATV